MKFQKEEKKGGTAENNVVGGDEALAVSKKRIST